MKDKLQSANNKKYKYVYQTKNLINGKTYIGYHCTNNLEDGYIGCGCRSTAYARGSVKKGLKSAFLRSVAKYGYENFHKEILSFYDTVEECLDEESFLVTKDWVDLSTNYNSKLGGLNSGYNLFVTTKKEEESVFNDFMDGMTKKEIVLKYKISKSVIYRITKDRDTTNRLIKPSKATIRNTQKVNSQKDSIIKRFLEGESKSSIQRTIDFDQFKSNILKNLN